MEAVTRRRLALWSGIALLGGTLAAAAAVARTPADHPAAPAASSSASPVPALACQARQVDGDWLPDPVCTPGQTNTDVNQANIAATICKSGWATVQREKWFPYSVSEPVKRHMVAVYGRYAGPALGGYELDHLVPISLGGSLSDARNLWVEAPATWNRKDSVESAANTAVCKGRMPLETAQALMASDWRRLGDLLGVKYNQARSRGVSGD